MKKLIFVTIFSILFMGCNDRKYYLSNNCETFIPDSNKVKYEQFIEKTVSAASYHMTTADYEDPEDVIREATKQANKLYGIAPFHLNYEGSGSFCGMNYEQMTPEEVKIFDSLLVEYKKIYSKAIQ